MLWDADISPVGITEQVKFDLGPQFSLTLIGGQFAFNDNPENAFYDGNGTTTGPRVAGGDNNTDAYLAYQQIVGTFKVTNDITVTAAPGFLFYPGHGGTGAAATSTTVNGVTTISTGPNSPSSGAAGAGRGAGNGTGQNGNVLTNSAPFNSANSSRNLSIGTLDGDVKLGLGSKLKLKVYGQAAYNFKGGARDAQEYAPLATTAAASKYIASMDSTTDKLAFSTGFTIGSDYQIKKNGDYVFLAEYRQVGLGSVDPNLNDSDWNFSRLGFRGIKIAGSYGFYSWLIGTVTYYGANNLGSEKNLNIGVGNYNTSHIVQFDLTAKF